MIKVEKDDNAEVATRVRENDEVTAPTTITSIPKEAISSNIHDGINYEEPIADDDEKDKRIQFNAATFGDGKKAEYNMGLRLLSKTDDLYDYPVMGLLGSEEGGNCHKSENQKLNNDDMNVNDCSNGDFPKSIATIDPTMSNEPGPIKMMRGLFQFHELPHLAKERIAEYLDAESLASLRLVSIPSNLLVISKTNLLQKMQVQIHRLRDIHQIQEEMATPSLLLPIWNSFRINPPHRVDILSGQAIQEEDTLIPFFVEIFGHNIRKLEINRRISHEDLEHLIFSLPDNKLFKTLCYITGIEPLPINQQFSFTQSQRLLGLVELTFPTIPLLGKVLSISPNLKRLTLVSTHWGEYYDTASELTTSVTTTLLTYLKNTFQLHVSHYTIGARTEVMKMDELIVDFSPPLPFTTQQLLSILSLCRHPFSNKMVVRLNSISGSSLPLHNTPLHPKVMDSLNSINSILVGDSDGDRRFPSSFLHTQNENNRKVIYCLNVGDRTLLADIDIPLTTPLTDLILRTDTHPWSLRNYIQKELRHALSQLFDFRPYLRNLEITRLVIDRKVLLDKYLQFDLFPNLRSLTIKRFGDSPSQFGGLCEGLPHLERLALSHLLDEHQIGEEERGFPPIFKLTNLRSLTISESHITKRSMKVLGMMKLDTLILKDSNNCPVHEMKMSWVDEQLGVGGYGVGPLGSWISTLTLTKPKDWKDEVIVEIKFNCPFLKNLHIIPQQISQKYHPEGEALGSPICRLIRQSPDFQEVWEDVRKLNLN